MLRWIGTYLEYKRDRPRLIGKWLKHVAFNFAIVHFFSTPICWDQLTAFTPKMVSIAARIWGLEKWSSHEACKMCRGFDFQTYSWGFTLDPYWGFKFMMFRHRRGFQVSERFWKYLGSLGPKLLKRVKTLIHISCLGSKLHVTPKKKQLWCVFLPFLEWNWTRGIDIESFIHPNEPGDMICR